MSFVILIYLPIYFLLQKEASLSNSNGWEFYILPLLNDPLFWFKKSIGYYWLGFFTSMKFAFLLLPLMLKSKRDYLLVFISFICVNIQFIVSGGDNTRYWLIFFIPFIYILNNNLVKFKNYKIVLLLILTLNIITPKHYVFTDANKGNMYVTPYGSKLHIFDYYSFFDN